MNTWIVIMLVIITNAITLKIGIEIGKKISTRYAGLRWIEFSKILPVHDMKDYSIYSVLREAVRKENGEIVCSVYMSIRELQ